MLQPIVEQQQIGACADRRRPPGQPVTSHPHGHFWQGTLNFQGLIAHQGRCIG
jgi:hypothetical protein